MPLHIDGVPDASCHDAMLDCAKFIKSQLETKQLLERAFSSLQVCVSTIVVPCVLFFVCFVYLLCASLTHTDCVCVCVCMRVCVCVCVCVYVHTCV